MTRSFVDPEEWEPRDRPEINVETTPPEVVGVILGPDGEPLRLVLDRPVVPFGFIPPRGDR